VKKPTRDPADVLADRDALDRAMVAARRRVILRHRQLGIPLAIWRDGRVVEVSADSVELPEYDSSQRASE
jgi:hypothetical protein